MRDTYSIPAITNARLAELAARIKPLVRKDGLHYYIEPCELRSMSFLWEPVFAEPARGLKMLVQIRTLHTFGYYGFFKPSIAEVLSQIPAELIDAVRAFEVEGPQDAAELNRESEALNAGFQVATTTLYR